MKVTSSSERARLDAAQRREQKARQADADESASAQARKRPEPVDDRRPSERDVSDK
jgi:hypothetical protein